MGALPMLIAGAGLLADSAPVAATGADSPPIWQWALFGLAVVVAVWALFVAILYAGGRGPAARALARLIPDLLVLFKRLLADPRVPRRAKVALALCLGYLALPFDLVPDFIPVVGALDDAVIVAFVLRYALGSTGADLVSELWPGPPESLKVIVSLAGEQKRSSLSLLWAVVFGVLAPALAFVLLAEDVWEREAFDWDEPVLRFFDTHQDPSLTVLTQGVTQLGGVGFASLLLLAAISVPLIARLRREAAFLFVAVAGAGVLNVLLKGFFDRPRPEVFPHLVETMTSSFPSGHTMTSAALALAVLVLLRRSAYFWPAATVAIAYALSVALSRLYLGVHFPSDVVAGWCISVAWVTVVWLLVLNRPDPGNGGGPVGGELGATRGANEQVGTKRGGNEQVGDRPIGEPGSPTDPS